MIFLLFLSLLIIIVQLRKYNRLLSQKKALESELNSLTERLYGSRENYEKVKESYGNQDITSVREYQIAKECADKGIERTRKQYPSRYKSTRS
jgi:predicted Holliday junction resolvase-like endonuclease